jgi:hypothetical protein
MIKNKQVINEEKRNLIDKLLQDRRFAHYDGEIKDDHMIELLFAVYPYKYMNDELVIHHAFRSKTNYPLVVRQIIRQSPQDQ